MAYLRLSTVSNDNGPAPETWGQHRYGALPPRRRDGGRVLLGLVAILAGVWGLWLLLGTPMSPEPLPGQAVPRPLVFDVPPPRLTVEVDSEPPLSNHPETWGALPTAVGGPVAAEPLADIPPTDQKAPCEAATLTAQMTCVDPTLREAERRMTLAYEAVLAAGVVPAALGRSQARWLATRDEAARSSPEDLLAAYQLREEQLRSVAAALARRTASVGLAKSVATPPTSVILGLVPRTPVSAAKTAAREAAT